MTYYAHTADLPDGTRDLDETHWQPLRVHLENVAMATNGFRRSDQPALNT
jgi:hypothetical protein